MKTLTLFLFIFCMSVWSTYGQSFTEKNASHSFVSKHNLGVNAGLTTGLGLSYLYMPGKNGFQLTTLPLYDEYNKFRCSIGTTYIREIRQYEMLRMVAYASNHFTNIYNYDNEWDDYIGIGMGLDMVYGHFVLHGKVGYAALEIINDFKLRPTVEVGIHFMI